MKIEVHPGLLERERRRRSLIRASSDSDDEENETPHGLEERESQREKAHATRAHAPWSGKKSSK